MHDRVIDRDDLPGIFDGAGHIDACRPRRRGCRWKYWICRCRAGHTSGSSGPRSRPGPGCRSGHGGKIRWPMPRIRLFARHLHDCAPIGVSSAGHRPPAAPAWPRNIPTATGHPVPAPCRHRSADSPSHWRSRWRAACRWPPSMRWLRARSTSSCVSGTGRQIARARSSDLVQVHAEHGFQQDVAHHHHGNARFRPAFWAAAARSRRSRAACMFIAIPIQSPRERAGCSGRGCSKIRARVAAIKAKRSVFRTAPAPWEIWRGSSFAQSGVARRMAGMARAMRWVAKAPSRQAANRPRTKRRSAPMKTRGPWRRRTSHRPRPWQPGRIADESPPRKHR